MHSISRMQEVLRALPRGAFEQIVQRHQGDRYAKKFFSWDHLVAMVYLQLAGAASLRQLQAGFNAHRSHHYHLNAGCVARSTLADANDRRSPLIFAELLQLLMTQGGRRLRREREELRYLLDATRVGTSTKLHLMLEGQSGALAHASLTAQTVNDISEARKLAIEAGATTGGTRSTITAHAGLAASSGTRR